MSELRKKIPLVTRMVSSETNSPTLTETDSPRPLPTGSEPFSPTGSGMTLHSRFNVITPRVRSRSFHWGQQTSSGQDIGDSPSVLSPIALPGAALEAGNDKGGRRSPPPGALGGVYGSMGALRPGHLSSRKLDLNASANATNDASVNSLRSLTSSLMVEVDDSLHGGRAGGDRASSIGIPIGNVSDSDDDEDAGEDHLSLLDPYFDLTTSRLRKIFAAFDQDDDGVVTYESFRRGLSAMGIETTEDASFNALIKNVDSDNSGGITYQEFETAVQMIKMADLFKPDTIAEINADNFHPPAPLKVVDYSAQKVRFQAPIRDQQRFFFAPLSSWATVRWINLEGIDQLAIKRLAIKFRLHPLSIEDVLKDERQRPKFEIYEDHTFTVLPMLQIVRNSPSKAREQRDSLSKLLLGAKPASEEPHHHRLTRRASAGTVISPPLQGFAGPGHGSGTAQQAHSHEEETDFSIEIAQVSMFILSNTVITIEDYHSPVLWNSMKKRLEQSYSKVRQNDASFLIYTLLDSVVDELVPIIVAFQLAILKMEKQLHAMRRVEDFKLNRLQAVKRQILVVHRAIKPMREVVRNLIDDEVLKKNATMYLRDVHDHLVQMLEDLEFALESCKNMSEEFHNLRTQRQNEVMYILTLVTTMFIPAQFLTGVYGMNFDFMPELHYKYGYYIWWCVVMTFFIFLFFYFRSVKKWI